MSGAAQDEAARLEAALARIGRAASRPRAIKPAEAALPGGEASGRTAAPDRDVAERLDALIAELRGVLGTGHS